VSEPFLTVENVSKRFGRVEALRAVSLDVGPDEFVVVLGPTGAGKTTLLRVVAGLETPDSGAVRMAGRDVTGLPPAARDVALVFQNFSLYPNWTVRKNLAFPLQAPGRRIDRAEVGRRIEWAAELLRIDRLLDRPARMLSGGEMQRVAIGRAIVRRPRAFLFDEPLTNLDAKLREALRVELAVLRRQLQTPMLYVTHDQAEALSMGDRVVVLAAGGVLQTGTPEEVYRRPASPDVARQLGQPPINLIPVTRRAGHWVTDAGVPVAPVDPASAPAGDRMLLGLRPEHVAPDGGRHDAVVRVIEDMGASRILLVDWAGCEVHVLVPGEFPARVGDRLRPRVDPAAVCLWPRQDDAARPATQIAPPTP